MSKCNTEEWKSVENYEGLYEVSNLGRVRSVDRIVRQNNRGTWVDTKYKGQILKQSMRSEYYLAVSLSKKNVRTTHNVHSLVATAFCERKHPTHIVVNHLNEIQTDNKCTNLEWTTSKGNANHGGRNKKISKAMEDVSRPVIATCVETGEETRYHSVWEAGKHYNRGNIYNCFVGRQKTAYGFTWKYEGVAE